MADKQSGTGARGNSQNRPEGQGSNKHGNHTKTSTDNRSHQVKETNSSTRSNDNSSSGRTGNRQ